MFFRSGRVVSHQPGIQRCEAFFTGCRPVLQARSASEWILGHGGRSTRWRFVLLTEKMFARHAKFWHCSVFRVQFSGRGRCYGIHTITQISSDWVLRLVGAFFFTSPRSLNEPLPFSDISSEKESGDKSPHSKNRCRHSLATEN